MGIFCFYIPTVDRCSGVGATKYKKKIKGSNSSPIVVILRKDYNCDYNYDRDDNYGCDYNYEVAAMPQQRSHIRGIALFYVPSPNSTRQHKFCP